MSSPPFCQEYDGGRLGYAALHGRDATNRAKTPTHTARLGNATSHQTPVAIPLRGGALRMHSRPPTAESARGSPSDRAAQHPTPPFRRIVSSPIGRTALTGQRSLHHSP
ncbi:ribonuclease HI [Trypanosoma cruzi]|nr:ribonuclease HI [Trypanosoma cruzi]